MKNNRRRNRNTASSILQELDQDELGHTRQIFASDSFLKNYIWISNKFFLSNKDFFQPSSNILQRNLPGFQPGFLYHAN